MRSPFTLTDEGFGEQIVFVAVTGDLDLWSAPALEQRLGACLERGQCWIVVDLSKASFLDSSGLGALTNSMRRIERKGGRLVVINTDPQAPILAHADYAVIGDVNAVVPALTDEIGRRSRE